MSNGNELLALRDAHRNPADEVHYYDGRPWPTYADGGGSSLELRSPDADNSRAEAWASSDETDKAPWRTYSYRAISVPGPGTNDPVVWDEMILGLLDAGEILLDDISVVEDPDGAAIELIQDGEFNNGLSRYRVQGNHGIHGLTSVIEDPTNPGSGDMVMHLVATGASEHMHNHVETTFANGQSLDDGTVYEVSYRAKWLAGSTQLNTRMYFNRLPKTTILENATQNGTPGRQNSRFETNVGPTYAAMHHHPSVPDAGEAVTVSIDASDTDGVASMLLWYSVDGGVWNSAAMQVTPAETYEGSIPGQAARSVVQFYVEGTDGAGAVSTFPAAGQDARALYKVDDGLASSGPHHNFRIIMSAEDIALQLQEHATVSNHGMGATVILNEQDVYYDVQVRLKGSGFSRAGGARGYNIRFHADDLFRGVHDVIAVDRNGGPVWDRGESAGNCAQAYRDPRRWNPRHVRRSDQLHCSRQHVFRSCPAFDGSLR